jgi:Flp pilus assembly protein TadB
MERGWKDQNTPRTAEQLIAKKTGPLTRTELDAGPDWHDELAMLPYMNSPRAPAQAIFWKKPFIVVFYSLAVLGGPILTALATLAVVGFLIVRMVRRRRRRGGIETE